MHTRIDLLKPEMGRVGRKGKEQARPAMSVSWQIGQHGSGPNGNIVIMTNLDAQVGMSQPVHGETSIVLAIPSCSGPYLFIFHMGG